MIDSGRWTWDHVDHFHYYLAEPRIVGTLPGAGPATVATGMLATAGGTGVFFAGSGEAVLLDNAALADGRITERFRIATDTGAGLIAPLGDGAVVADGHEIVRYSAAGAMQGTATPCTAPAGAITTRVALVIGCAEGAVFATAPGAGAATGTDAAAGTDATAGTDADAGTDAGTDTDPGAVPATTVPGFETVPYPAGGGADRALSLDGRKGRPTVAGRTGGPGFWLLDTRARAWQFVPTTAVLERVVAVDDEAGHVVALDRDGRVRVFVAETGAEVGTTEPLVPTITDAVSLTVDSQRAYVNDPAGGVVHEIAYSGEARLARTLDTATTPDLIAEVGR
ncbi:ABC transporter [Leucobacter luti]|nr:ABC transporter [Leucobacter luti]